MYTIKKPNLQAKLNYKKLILTSKKLYPKITIVYLNISEVSEYILSECYRRRCNHIILKLHNHFNAISLGCCFNVIDSRLSDSMYSFIKQKGANVDGFSYMYTFYMLLFCAFFSCFQYQGCVYFRSNFFFYARVSVESKIP